MMSSVFQTLNNINVNDRTEKKNGLTYLSWAWAWAEVKKLYPQATYTIYERETANGPVNYFTDGKTCWVKTGVTIDGLEHVEDLPVMDYRNASIPLEKVTSKDINTSIQRSITKACARHGLGLYIYAGEDIPEEEASKNPKPDPITCHDCGGVIEDIRKRNGENWPADEVAAYSSMRFGRPLCAKCQKSAAAAEKANAI